MPTKEQLLTTILVVDDAKNLCEAFREVLHFVGYESVLIANDGLEATKILTNCGSSITVMITDILMPSMDGYELLEWISNNYDSPLRTIVMSAMSGLSERREFFMKLPTVVSVLPKPFSLDVLLETLRQCIEMR